MPRKKPQEPIVVNPLEPLKKCYDCIHWHMNSEGNKNGEVDFSSGFCDHNGYSKVPPMFTCNGWENGNGGIYSE